MYVSIYILCMFYFLISSAALLLQSQHNIFNSYLDGHGESLGLSQSNIDTVKQWFMIITYAFIGLAVLQVRTSTLTEHKFIPYYLYINIYIITYIYTYIHTYIHYVCTYINK